MAESPPRNPHRRGHGHRPTVFSERTYRHRIGISGLRTFHVVCQETDLLIQADQALEHEAREQVLACRAHIEGYIERFPAFATTLKPWHHEPFAPPIVQQMISAGRAAGVGPMAAVAGAVAEHVGRQLLHQSRQVMVENGGDIFLKTDAAIVAGLFSGHSPLSLKIGLKLPPAENGMGVCTSSGTVGHSLSAGSADAVCVLAPSAALADAAATAIGNRVHSTRDIKKAIEFGKSIPDVNGIVVVVDRELGAWGDVELVPAKGKKG